MVSAAARPSLRAKGEFALARPELDFDRAQRQAELLDVAAQNLQRRIEHVEARLGEILIALREQAHLRRFRRPGRIGRRKPRILELEQMEFDFEPGEEIEAGFGQASSSASRQRARVENGTGLPLVK